MTSAGRTSRAARARAAFVHLPLAVAFAVGVAAVPGGATSGRPASGDAAQAGAAAQQGANPRSVAAGADTPAAATRWAVGEFLEYTLKYGALSVGSGRMQVLGRQAIRGRDTWQLQFDFSGGTLFFRVNDAFVSWLDVRTLNSLRFEQRISEPGYKRNRVYEIFPDRSVFTLKGGEDKPSVADPLDDATFFYFIRTIPLDVGKSYDFYRYFDPKANPVTIRVLRRDTVSVPAGTFPAIVIQPLIKTSGIFSEGGQAELWLSDDDRRILLQMKSKLSFGSLNLYLRKYVLPPLTPNGPTLTSPP
ncbi:MAG: DUF3108 domain-containing protein [Gemmatimonadaceae bacterium]|nr:DUF3108 domain-containing protein [Gemmatimonadaceae bacterium]